MLKLSRYLSGHRLESVLSPLFKMIEAALSLAVPVIVARIIDIGIGQRDSDYVTSGGILLIALAVVGLFAAIVAQYFAASAATGLGTALREELFAHVLSLSKEDMSQIGEASLVTRLTTDTVQVQEGFNRFFRLVLRSPFIVFGSLVLAFAIDGSEGLIFTVSIAVLFVIVFCVMRVAVRRYHKANDSLDAIGARVASNLAGKRTIRAYRREEYEMDAFSGEVDELLVDQVRAGHAAALTNPLTYAVINIGLICVLWVGGVKVDEGTLTTGAVVALVNYASQILVELIKLADLIVLMARSSAAAARINEVFEVVPSIQDGFRAAQIEHGSVEFRNVSFTYRGAHAPALEQVSFSVAPGRVLGVIGGTGSGKSTIASLISREYDATSGEVLISGADIRDYPLSALARAISVVEQKVRLFSGTILQNLIMGSDSATKEDVVRALKISQAAGILESREDGLNATIEESGSNLSGGQRQRLAIARALIANPKILVLDDATSALDYMTEARLRSALATELRDTTVVMIAQRVSAVRGADQILVLDNGRQVGLGTHEQLLRTCEVYQQICASQLGSEEVA